MHTRSINKEDIIKIVLMIFILAYSAVLLFGGISTITNIENFQSASDEFKAFADAKAAAADNGNPEDKDNMDYVNSIKNFSQNIIVICTIILFAFIAVTLAYLPLSVIGVLKSPVCLTILMVLSCITLLVLILLIGSMDFKSGSVIIGFNWTMVTLTTEQVQSISTADGSVVELVKNSAEAAKALEAGGQLVKEFTNGVIKTSWQTYRLANFDIIGWMLGLTGLNVLEILALLGYKKYKFDV